MQRILTAVVVIALLAGSVPAAATLADGTPSDTEPGAAFSGVVGVQESEVNSEVADRALNQRLNAAKTNESKAGVVATESADLQERLAELETKKAELKASYENGSISKGEYQARLAILSADLRAVERQANKTADVAETLPEEALREKGANVSEVRAIAQQANRTGGGEVAEAARAIAGEGVGNGLGNAPNASGPPSDVGNGDPAGDATNATKESDRGADADTDPAADVKTGDGQNESTTNKSANGSDGSGQSDAANQSTEADNEQNQLGAVSPSTWFDVDLSIDRAISGIESAVPGTQGVTMQQPLFG